MEKLKLIIVFCCVTLVVSSIVFVATSCSWNGEEVVSDSVLQNSYETLYDSASSREELVASLVEFEVANPTHFKSKLDLAQWYFSLGDYVLSWQYLQRALSLINEAGCNLIKNDKIITSDTIGEKDISLPKGIFVSDLELLHRLLAYLCLFRDDVTEAEKYANISLVLSKYHLSKLENHNESLISPILYLMGQVLFSVAEDEEFTQKETIEKSLEYFDKAYKLNPQNLSSIHLLDYGKLLALVNRYGEAESMLEKYLENGNWTVDTAVIAKQMYSATKNTYKEKICEFIYEDYVKGALNLNEENIVNEINSRLWIEEFKNMSTQQTEEISFFGETYCKTILRYEDGMITKGDLDSLIEVEPYFINFPSYYWLLWTIAKNVLREEDWEVFIPALKKIIALNPSGIYAQAARQEIQSLVVTQVSDKQEKYSMLDKILF